MAENALGKTRQGLVNKPWAKLRVSRKQYAAARPWKKAGMTRGEFESLLDSLPDEIITAIHMESDAEKLASAIFGAS